MHTLYSFPFSCSFAVKAQLTRHSVPFEVRTVARGPAMRSEDSRLVGLNPKRKVPVLCTPGGETLTEIISILDYLDRAHGPSRTEQTRRAILEDLAFVGTELHQAILAPLFDPDSPEVTKHDVITRLFPPLAAILAERAPAMDIDASPAVTYLFWGLLLLEAKGVSLLPNLRTLVARQLQLAGIGELLDAERRASRQERV